MPAGDHSVDWTGLDGAGRPVASGIYLYQLEMRGATRQRKLTLVR
jgi:hypothetical protein